MLKELKPSNYNYYLLYNHDDYIGYNFLYKSMIRLPKEAYSIINNKDFSNFTIYNYTNHAQLTPPQWLESLQEAKFLIDKKIDELAIIKYLYFRNLYANDSLSLTVLPTLWCNFNCPYCNEMKRPLFMNSETEDALIKWIENNFKNKRRIMISWFGGEPLLGKKIIFRLTKRIKNFCKTIGANYSAGLTTNGYYLDKDFINVLDDLGIKGVHITLDGNDVDHDKLRKRRNGSGTFNRIFDNIIAFCENSSNCSLKIRVNCCDENYTGVEELLKKFPHSVLDRAQLYFRWIYADEANNYQEFSLREQGKDPYLGLAKLYSAALNMGWNVKNPLFYYRSAYCEVDFLDHYAISPNGNIFLCSHTYKDSEAIGSILQGPQFINQNAISKYIKWYAADPFNDDMCIKCKLLPICSGGCRKWRVMGQRSCLEEKRNIDSFVKNLVEQEFIINKIQLPQK